jgi:hypothetical protein
LVGSAYSVSNPGAVEGFRQKIIFKIMHKLYLKKFAKIRERYNFKIFENWFSVGIVTTIRNYSNSFFLLDMK